MFAHRHVVVAYSNQAQLLRGVPANIELSGSNQVQHLMGTLRHRENVKNPGTVRTASAFVTLVFFRYGYYSINLF